MRKFLLISVSIISFLILLGISSLILFAKVASNQRTCKWANIDNVELHASINIPEVIKSECDYNEESNTKKAYFAFDVNKIKIEKYIENNQLIKLDSTSNGMLIKLLNFPSKPKNHSLMYYKTTYFNGETTYSLVDFISGEIWVCIEYCN